MEVENKGMNIAEVKKAFIWDKQYTGIYVIEILETLEKSVREDIHSNKHHNTTVEIGPIDRYWLGWVDALKEVLGEEK